MFRMMFFSLSFCERLQKLDKRHMTKTLPPGVEIIHDNFDSYNTDRHPGTPGEADSPSMPWMKIGLLMLVFVMYVGSPLDLIPDFIPVLGQMDDLLVGGGILSMVLKTVLKYFRIKTAFSLRRVGIGSVLRTSLARAAVKQVIKRK
jgi:uncharacterized membrane protein YkvA (DUF1232 family)